MVYIWRTLNPPLTAVGLSGKYMAFFISSTFAFGLYSNIFSITLSIVSIYDYNSAALCYDSFLWIY